MERKRLNKTRNFCKKGNVVQAKLWVNVNQSETQHPDTYLLYHTNINLQQKLMHPTNQHQKHPKASRHTSTWHHYTIGDKTDINLQFTQITQTTAYNHSKVANNTNHGTIHCNYCTLTFKYMILQLRTRTPYEISYNILHNFIYWQSI